MSQSLAKDFNFHSLLKFAFPSIIMMIFMSLYSIVDGFFIAQYVDSMALSAANIVYPAVSILLAVGIMFGTGGSAVVAAKIGQEKQEEANRNFSALTLTTLIIGILGAVLGNLPPDLQSARCNAGADGLRYRLSADDPFLCPGLSSPGAVPVLLCNGRTPGTRTFPYGVRRHYQHASGLSVCRSAPSWCCRSCPCHRPWPVHSGRCRHFILYLRPQRPSLHPSGIFQRPALHKLLQRFLRDGQQSFCSRCHLPFQHADAEI